MQSILFRRRRYVVNNIKTCNEEKRSPKFFYNYILSYEKIFVKFINHKIFEKYKFFVQKCGLREISGTGCVAACAARDTQRHGRPFGRMLLGVA